tara:strand:- start:124 stop:423 length:300 start_codon:yes stop_codon:yes gene_type:complete
MSTFAFTQEQFDDFKKSSNKSFSILPESSLSTWNFSSIIKKWADIGVEEPPHVRMYTDDSDVINLAYMTFHGGFISGHVYVIFDTNVINKYNIKLNAGE